MLNMGNLAVVVGQGAYMMNEGLSIHAGSLEIDDFHLAVQQLYIKTAIADETGHLAQDFVREAPAVGDQADAQRGRLPLVVIVNLSYGDVEPILELAGDGFEHLPLALEG
jgi:hypothetical protein